MERRKFLKIAGLGITSLSVPAVGWAKANSQPSTKTKSPTQAAPWRSVELTARVRLQGEAGGKVWLPVPMAKTSYQEHSDTLWTGNFTKAGILKDETYGAPFFYAEWDKGGPVELDTTYRVRLRDRTGVEPAADGDRELYLKPSKHIPIDGIVQMNAMKIVGKETDPDRKARLIYEWMVENTARDAKVRGCGLGDVQAMLESGNLQGKCVDLSSLFVGLCRASGIPAREIYGLRVLPSKFSKSIGKETDVTGGQHCRAEYYSSKKGGWVPVDPADVRKVILEEKMTLKDPLVADLRKKFFGFWEMNWVAFNSARDFNLPPAPGTAVNFMMYPYYAAANVSKDGMDPKDFQYTILAKEV